MINIVFMWFQVDTNNLIFFLFSMNKYQYLASDRPKNYKVALAIILLMSTGVGARLIWIW